MKSYLYILIKHFWTKSLFQEIRERRKNKDEIFDISWYTYANYSHSNLNISFGGKSISFFLTIKCLVIVIVSTKENNQLFPLALGNIIFSLHHSLFCWILVILFYRSWSFFPFLFVLLIFTVLLLLFANMHFSKSANALKTWDNLYPTYKCIHSLKSIMIEYSQCL